MYFLEELKDFKLYKRKVVLPFNDSNKKMGSYIYLMTPNIESSINILNHPLFTPKYFQSLYIERNATLYISDDGKAINNVTNESAFVSCREYTGVINDDYIQINADKRFIIGLDENAKYDTKIRRILWNQRIRNVKELNALYSQIKSKVPYIDRTYYDIKRYKGRNLFVDLSFYLSLFSQNNVYKLDNGMKLYQEFITRILTKGAYVDSGAKKTTLFIDYFGWKSACSANEWMDLLDWKKTINPLSMMWYMIKKGIGSFDSIFNPPIDFVIVGKDGYFKVKSSDINPMNLSRFKFLIAKLDANEIDEDTDLNQSKDSTKVIAMQTIEKIEKASGISIDNISRPKYLVGTKDETSKVVQKAVVKQVTKSIPEKKEKEIKAEIIEKEKEAIVKQIYDKAEEKETSDEVIDDINNNDYINNVINAIAKESNPTTKISSARAARTKELSNSFLKKKMNNEKTIKDMIENSEKVNPIPESAINIDSINDEWKHMKFINFEKVYDPDDDIVSILNFLGTLSHPISVIDLKVEDTTTSEDYIKTYFVQCENEKGKRFSLIFDVPKIKQGRFMKLRGNDKVLNGQLVLLPCVKTDDDTVQLVSNYKKIFIRRHTSVYGKSSPAIDRLIKALNKYKEDDIKVTYGDSSRLCAKYNLPYDYIDLSSTILKIETGNYIFYMNQNEIRTTYEIPDEDIIKHEMNDSFPIGYNKREKTIIWSGQIEYDNFGVELIRYIDGDSTTKFCFANVEAQNSASRYCYSMASILSTEIPVIVVLGYSYGLSTIIKAIQDVNITDKAPARKDFGTGSIKFKDGYITFNNYNASAMLFNGLKDCDTEDYSITDIDDQNMWLDFLDEFGGRIKADGLDNFKDLFVDPKTKAICDLYKLPNTYFDLLMYSNVLLCDNKYNKHTDLTGNRFRENEIIAGYVYLCLATAYGAYANAFKRKQNVAMTIKRSAVIDAILLDPTCSDLSKETPLLEKESASSVGFKGLSGMNSDRSYNLDKRTYDDTMLNKIALSTGFAENVGITRQGTIDMDIKDNMGTLSDIANPDDLSITKTFSITEAINPFSTTRDDPFRIAMTFIQSSKHTMETAASHPLLVTNGSDEALPYMTTDTFAWKAKGKGKVVEKTDEYMIIQYDDPKIPSEFVDLRESVEKNSDGGFFMSIKLDTDLKLDSRVKEGQVVAYDHKVYSDIVGATDNIAFTPGLLTKIAIPMTYEGFEDSAMVTEYISEAMESEVIIKKEKVLDKNSNVYYLVKKGDKVQEGDPLLIYQHAYEDKDLNVLIKNLSKDDIGDDDISELGRITLRSKYTGIVQDVKILRTCDIDDMSDSLKEIVTKNESNIRKYKKVMNKYKTDNIEAFDADYKLEPTGVLKNCPDGVKIFIYVKYFDKLSVGDKIVNWSALKGVIRNIPPKGQEPYSEYRPEEEISSMFSMNSVNARMVSSIQIVGGINKGLIELDRQVKEIMDIPWKTIKEYDEENLKKNHHDI